jgi:DnaJ domain
MVMLMDPYSVLGVKIGAPLKDVKARYRELARIHHPDKLHGLSEEDLKRHEEKFKEITAAYHLILGMGGSTAGCQESSKWQDIWRRVQSMLANRDLWDALRGAVQKSRTHVVELDVSLEEIYCNKPRKLRLVLNGITEPVYVTAYSGNFPQVDIPYVPKDALDPIPHTIRIIMHDKPHPVYTISDLFDVLDLYTEVSLTWLDYVRGTTRELDYLDGTKIAIEIRPFIQERNIIKKGMGIRGGDLYVSVVVRRPLKELWDAMEESAKNGFCKILENFETRDQT